MRRSTEGAMDWIFKAVMTAAMVLIVSAGLLSSLPPIAGAVATMEHAAGADTIVVSTRQLNMAVACGT